MKELIKLYTTWAKEEPSHVVRIEGAGSNREYYRIYTQQGNSVVGVVGTSVDENRAFLYLTEHFSQRQLPVPQLLAQSEDYLRYLQTDLGNRSLFGAIKGGREAGGRYNQKEKQLLINTIRELPNIQVRGARGLDWSNCYPQPEFDVDNVLFDLNYFKYCFLKPTELDFHEMKLEANFRMFAKDLTSETFESFMYRDFQARNILLDEDGNPYFIDYQGGRKGPYYYDLASFLWQASAKYSYKLFERKQHFIDSIPMAMDNLRDLLSMNEEVFPYPYLMDVLRRLTELPQFAKVEQPVVERSDGYKITDRPFDSSNPLDGPATFSKYDGKGPLVVKVFSFSYRKGIPEDDSGNGGGYVFDCRSTHNPGRYEPYKNLTGLDEPVIRFLEDDGEILTFLDSVYQLADHHVQRYLQRGFTSLMFSFGCTGGQHRSVYSAQHLAEYIHQKYGVEVRICHREQNIKQVLK